MIRIGVDFGGTKIEAAALAAGGQIVSRQRRPNPGGYEAALDTVRELVESVEREAGAKAPAVGFGIPGSVSPRTGLIRNANSQWLNGKPFREDLERTLGRPVRVENDANCMALSEASDGAAAGAAVVFGVIVGTGCGGGLVVRGQTVTGHNGVGGEWGHMPLPWPSQHEMSRRCWCGQNACMELFVSGTGFSADSGRPAPEAIAAARAGDAAARAALDRYIDRLGRGLAVICNVVDPEVIVLGGGMSNVDELYDALPGVIASRIFSDVFETKVVRATHGDSSGVRGAAWLWPV